jgi:hypothetical protein
MARRASSTEQPAEGLPTTPIRASRSLASSAAMPTLRSTLQPSGPAGQAMLPDGPIEEAGWELRAGLKGAGEGVQLGACEAGGVDVPSP